MEISSTGANGFFFSSSFFNGWTVVYPLSLKFSIF